MRVYPDSILTFHLASLVRHLRAQGPACDEVLQAHRLTSAALELPGARIPRELMVAVLLHLSARLGREDLGFEMGWQTDLLSHPLIGRLLHTSRTLGEGWQCMAPYMPLMTPSFRMQCERQDDGALVVTWRPVRPLPYDVIRVALETVLVSAYRTSQQLFPSRPVPMQMRVSWASPPHAHRYASLPNLDMAFQAGEPHPSDLVQRPHVPDVGAWLRLPAATAAMALPRANARVWSDTHAACAQQLQQLQTMQAWTVWISHILDAVEDHQPSQAELAGLMGISERTLARHLEAEGAAFRPLALQIRHRRACELLNAPTSISEIARILGYSDSANFSRAFKAQAGVSPQGWRQAHASHHTATR